MVYKDGGGKISQGRSSVGRVKKDLQMTEYLICLAVMAVVGLIAFLFFWKFGGH